MPDPELYPSQSSMTKPSEAATQAGGYQPRTVNDHQNCHDGRMSYDVFLQNFENGQSSTADHDAVYRLLEPNLRDRDGSFALLATPDGEADLYGIDDLRSGFMANHISGTAVWDTLYGAATLGPYVIMPVGCPVCLTTEEARRHLPEAFASTAVVISSGAELWEVVSAD